MIKIIFKPQDCCPFTVVNWLWNIPCLAGYRLWQLIGRVSVFMTTTEFSDANSGIRTSPPTVLSTFIREVRWLQELLKMKIKPETLEGALIFKLKLGLLSW